MSRSVGGVLAAASARDLILGHPVLCKESMASVIVTNFLQSHLPGHTRVLALHIYP